MNPEWYLEEDWYRQRPSQAWGGGHTGVSSGQPREPCGWRRRVGDVWTESKSSNGANCVQPCRL